jgi:hypothetical protein
VGYFSFRDARTLPGYALSGTEGMHSLLNLSELIHVIHHVLIYVFFLFIGAR